MEPYRVLFPIGIAFALIGAALWPLHVLGLIGYPGAQHWELMMLGFEQAFIMGFLLTAMPGLTHGERCRPWELKAAVASILALAVGILFQQGVMTAIASLAAVVIVMSALLRRVIAGRARPPEEFVFVALALGCGLAGGLLRLVGAFGWTGALPPRFADRLISLGMVLPLVLGLGSLLVPTFAGLRDPLVIQGIAGPHERRGRRVLYAALVLLLAGSFAADLAGRRQLGHALRALPAWTLILLAWRPWRRGNASTLSVALRIAGPLTALGVTLAALVPRWEVAALHVTFIGGFALLTMGVGTRVVVSHGRRPAMEATVLTFWMLAGMGLTLALRLVAEWQPAAYLPWLAASAGAWLVTWMVWGFRIFGVLATSPAPSPVKAAEG